MTRRLLLLLGSSALAACSPAPTTPPPESARPPVVVVSIDTLRSDHLSPWGYAAGETPAIDALARESLLFERAFAEIPLTLPSHASLFTGRIPPRHGVRDNLGFRLDAGAGATLAERLRSAGYATFGAVSSAALARRSGIDRGFDGWDEPAATAAAERPGSEALGAALAWLDLPESRPRFLFVHFYEPHAPYLPPEPFRSSFAGRPYDGEIAAADALVGDLVAALRARKLYDEALLVLLSDHGEGLGDHGEDEHGLLLYREALQVPLLVKLPQGRRAGERVARNVALVDVLPTVLEVLKLDSAPAEAPLDGLSLLSTAAPAVRAIYSETSYPLLHFEWSDLASVISGDLHLVRAGAHGREELFRFAADPGEKVDLRAEERRRAGDLGRELDRIDRSLAAPTSGSAADSEAEAQLGALGYLGRTRLPDDPSSLPDPRDRVREIAPLLEGIRELQAQQPAQAVDSLRRATSVESAAPHAWPLLAAAYDALGRKSEAADAYARAARFGGASVSLSEGAVLRLLELGRAQAAVELAREELARRSGDDNAARARLTALLSRALLQAGDVAEASRAADVAVRLDDRLADAHYQRAVVALARRDGSAALAELERAAALDPRHREARKALAMVLYSAGDLAGARRRLEEVLALDPADADALADLALLEKKGAG